MARNATHEAKQELITIANQLIAEGRGLLAADEGDAVVGARLEKIGVESNEANRQRFRHMMFKTNSKLSENLGGVILHHETIYQKDDKGVHITDELTKKNILKGIKTDLGWLIMPGSKGEMTTQGLDNLYERSLQYKKDGCSFAKWRCPLKIQNNGLTPSDLAISQCAEISGRYAAISQQAGLVPIVEPDVMLDGDHDIELCQQVSERVLTATFAALQKHNVLLEGMLLKTNMVTPGANCAKRADAKTIAKYTVECLRRTVPAAMPGVVFLSGGQTELDATKNLNEMNKIPNNPWKLSFSYSRAIQASVLAAWKGSNEEAGQAALLHRTTCNRLAALGKYESEEETTTKMESLFVANHAY